MPQDNQSRRTRYAPRGVNPYQITFSETVQGVAIVYARTPEEARQAGKTVSFKQATIVNKGRVVVHVRLSPLAEGETDEKA